MMTFFDIVCSLMFFVGLTFVVVSTISFRTNKNKYAINMLLAWVSLSVGWTLTVIADVILGKPFWADFFFMALSIISTELTVKYFKKQGWIYNGKTRTDKS